MLSGCRKATTYSPPIQKAIELFYIENQNDSILKILTPDLNLDNRNTTLKNILTAAALCESGDVDSASTLFSTIKINEKDKVLSYWYKHIGGLILFRENNMTEAYKMLETAVLGMSYDLRANALSERLIARILFTYGSDKEKGVEWMAKSSLHFQEAGLEKSIGINQKILGRFYMNIGNQKEALYFFQKSEQILEKYDDVAELYYIYINLNDYYIKTNNLDKAVEYAELCSSILTDWDDNQMKVVLNNVLGEIKFKQNKLDEAEPYFQETLNLSMDYMGGAAEVGVALVFLSKIYQHRANQAQAIEYALQAQQLFIHSARYFQSKHNVFTQLSELYNNMPDKKQYNSYKDSVAFYFNLLQQERANLSKNMYDVQIKLEQSTSDMEHMETKQAHQRLIIVIIVTALVCLTVLLVLLYYKWKAKNRLLKLLAQKNIQLVTEERIKLKEIQKEETDLKENTSRKQVDESKMRLLYIQIIEWLQTNQNYRIKNLTIDLLAEELNTNREYVSQAINTHDVKFNVLINRFRINEAIDILSDTENRLHTQKMSVIASEVGFKSESVFFDAFKKQTGMTPAQFRTAEKHTKP